MYWAPPSSTACIVPVATLWIILLVSSGAYKWKTTICSICKFNRACMHLKYIQAEGENKDVKSLFAVFLWSWMFFFVYRGAAKYGHILYDLALSGAIAIIFEILRQWDSFLLFIYFSLGDANLNMGGLKKWQNLFAKCLRCVSFFDYRAIKSAHAVYFIISLSGVRPKTIPAVHLMKKWKWVLYQPTFRQSVLT